MKMNLRLDEADITLLKLSVEARIMQLQAISFVHGVPRMIELLNELYEKLHAAEKD